MPNAPASTAPAQSEPAARAGDELARIAGAVAAVYRRAWGRGPVKTTAQWAGSTMLVAVLENGHNEAEKTLRAGGHADQVLRGRQLLQSTIEGELKSTVERITGRPVATVLGATRLDPDLSAQIFLFEPAGPAQQPHGRDYPEAWRLAGRLGSPSSRDPG